MKCEKLVEREDIFTTLFVDYQIQMIEFFREWKKKKILLEIN